MLRMIKQARAALSLLNPEEVRNRAARPLNVGLVAVDGAGYAEMEDFLLPAGLPQAERLRTMERVHRAGDRNAPKTVDLVLYEQGIPTGDTAYSFYRQNPESIIPQIIRDHEDLALPLARQFPAFRKPVVDATIRSVARENAFFAVATALPNVVPSLIELPWAFGEFASDTAFLTANQIRMAFLIAAAYGKDPGFSHQRVEVATIVASAFGWRALARELVGHIPLGGGLIPKGAIAYAGTLAVGKSLEYYHSTSQFYTPEQRREEYHRALDGGRNVAESFSARQ